MPDFDLASAQPIQPPQFDLASAQPVTAQNSSDAAPETAGRVAGLTGRALAAGAAGTPNAITSGFGALLNPGGAYLDSLEDAQPRGSPSAWDIIHPERWEGDVQSLASKLGIASPQTQGERIYSGAVSAVPGSFAGAEGLTIPRALLTAGAGLAGGGAAQTASEIGLPSPVAQVAGMAAGALTGRLTAPRAPLPIADDVLANMVANQSMGAAAATPNLANVSPAFKQAISAAAARTGGAVNPAALQRQLRAQSLPIPMDLTEGMALQDPTIISNEQNLRGQSPDMVNRINGLNESLNQNLQTLREQAGPDVFSTNPAEHADTLIDAYQAKNAAANAKTSAKYQALRDANGGDFPVDAQALLSSATDQLHQQLLFDHAPKEIMSTLNRLADSNSMTFENFESLRTNLARIQRSPTADGNTKAAAGIIRNSMEALPLDPDAAGNLKPLADAARASAKAQFDALAADPAYDAAVNGTVSPDRFISRFVVGGNRDDVATMKANLADNPAALQTMSVATIGALRDAARLNADYNGNFSPAGFNKTLQALRPKLGSLVTPDIVEHLENLGGVASDVKAQPAGSFVNNSNTFTALASKAGQVAIGALPGGDWINRGIDYAVDKRRVSTRVNRALAPGAGLDRLDLLRASIKTGKNP